MKAKEYLSRIQCIDICIRQKEAELKRIEEERTYISAIRYDKDRVNSSPSAEGFTRLSDKIADMTIEISNDKAKLIEARHRIIKQIESLADARYIDLLYKKYVELKSFEQIAYEMGYDYYHCLHLHGEALQSFEAIIGEAYITTN